MKYLLFLTLLTGCTDSIVDNSKITGIPDGLHRFYDRDTDTVCYFYPNHAISCVKLDNK